MIKEMKLFKEDSETFAHSKRVGDYSFLLALALGKDVATAEVWQQAGYLHDIGKITVPKSILHAPRKLTCEEKEIVSRHSEAGAKILEEAFVREEYIAAAKYHHTFFANGGKSIPLVARVIAVVDVYDALTSKRCYKAGMTKEQAIKTMEKMQEKMQFDPDIFSVWKAVIGVAPAEVCQMQIS